MAERFFQGRRLEVREFPGIRAKKITQGQRSQILVGIWKSMAQRFGGVMNAVDYLSPLVFYENGQLPHQIPQAVDRMQNHPRHEVDDLIDNDNTKFVMKAVGLTTDLNNR